MIIREAALPGLGPLEVRSVCMWVETWRDCAYDGVGSFGGNV